MLNAKTIRHHVQKSVNLESLRNPNAQFKTAPERQTRVKQQIEDLTRKIEKVIEGGIDGSSRFEAQLTGIKNRLNNPDEATTPLLQMGRQQV